jgi:hypothetical protein
LEQVRRLLREVVDRQKLATDTDVDVAAEQFVAPLFFRALITGETLEGLPARLVDQLRRAWAT